MLPTRRICSATKLKNWALSCVGRARVTRRILTISSVTWTSPRRFKSFRTLACRGGGAPRQRVLEARPGSCRSRGSPRGRRSLSQKSGIRFPQIEYPRLFERCETACACEVHALSVRPLRSNLLHFRAIQTRRPRRLPHGSAPCRSWGFWEHCRQALHELYPDQGFQLARIDTQSRAYVDDRIERRAQQLGELKAMFRSCQARSSSTTGRAQWKLCQRYNLAQFAHDAIYSSSFFL